MSFTKNLGRFEDEMRTLREKRTQPGWSFCEYFMVQVHGKKRRSVGLCYPVLELCPRRLQEPSVDSQFCLMCVSVQEELAFVFEMLQQFEDALVQYDELDALFTQYVLNFGAGGT